MSKSYCLPVRIFASLILSATVTIACSSWASAEPSKSNTSATSTDPSKSKTPKFSLSKIVPIYPSSHTIAVPNGHGTGSAQIGADEDFRKVGAGEIASNSLLVMPNKNDKEDAMQKIREVNGTVVRTIGSGENAVWEIEFPSQEVFLKAEKELVKDKHLKKIQRNFVFTVQTNDQYFPSQHYIGSLRVEKAWAKSPGEQSNTIAIIDTGVSLKNLDMVGKCSIGYDCGKDREKQKDSAGHGTMVATTAAATNNNLVLTAGPARAAQIFPINAYSKKLKGFATADLIEAMDQCIARGFKMVNLSLGHDNPAYSISNASYNSVLHHQFKTFHDNGGLVFNAAGNNGREDTLNPRVPYLIVVSATDTASGYLASFSKYGHHVWFTAPGTNIVCSSKAGKGKAVSVSGTSFSSPLVASIAALIWGAKPSLTNLQVEQILIQSANRFHDPRFPESPPGSRQGGYVVPNNVYGYGMPDAEQAFKMLFP